MAATTLTHTPLLRLQQTLDHLQAPSGHTKEHSLSIVHGPLEPALWDMTLGELLSFQCLRYHDLECLICPWTGARWTYGNLENESNKIARGLIAKGIMHGDRIAVMAGNCEQYVALFFAAARVGAILVVINNTYTHAELLYALQHVGMWTRRWCKKVRPMLTGLGCKLFFTVPNIGRHSLLDAMNSLESPLGLSKDLPQLKQTIIIRGRYRDFETYDDVIRAGRLVSMNMVQARQEKLSPSDVCNLQFTSGSTGNPKAAMLTH